MHFCNHFCNLAKEWREGRSLTKIWWIFGCQKKWKNTLYFLCKKIFINKFWMNFVIAPDFLRWCLHGKKPENYIRLASFHMPCSCFPVLNEKGYSFHYLLNMYFLRSGTIKDLIFSIFLWKLLLNLFRWHAKWIWRKLEGRREWMIGNCAKLCFVLDHIVID